MILKRKVLKSSRSFKVSEIIRKSISAILIKNELPLEEPFSFPINVTKVEMNSDLKIAYIYVTSHEGETQTKLIDKLNSCKNYLSKEVTKMISLKFTPKIFFRHDKTIESLRKIEEILNLEKVTKRPDKILAK